MKKMMAPALLCVAYTAVLAGLFSTDLIKESFFMRQSPSPNTLHTLSSDAIGPQLRHVVASKSVGKTNTHFSSAASPEGIDK